MEGERLPRRLSKRLSRSQGTHQGLDGTTSPFGSFPTSWGIVHDRHDGMRTRSALLEAILERPDDDDLRLVYADAVAEEGDTAHAELIQAQISLTLTPGDVDLRARVAALEETHGRRIAGEAITAHARQWWFERGLVGRIQIDLVTLSSSAAEVLGGAPIRALVLEDPDGLDVEALCSAASTVARCPHLARVVELDAALHGGFSGDEEGEALCCLLASTHLLSLRRLELDSYCKPGMAPAVANAAAAGRLLALRELVFGSSSGTDFGDDGAVALAAVQPLCARLEVLEAWGADLGPEGIAALVGAGLPSIKRLVLAPVHYASNQIGARGARALASASLARLEHLDLAANVIRDEGVAAIAAAPWLANVKELDLSDNALTDAALRSLAASAAGSLERLRLHQHTHGAAGASLNAFTTSGLRALESLPALRAISFQEYEWTPLPLTEAALARATR